VGANLGWFTLIMADAVAPRGEVWAIEPMPPILPALKRNLELNDQLAVRLFEVALGESPGTTEIHVFSGLPQGHASVSTLDRTDYRSHRVERSTLDELLADRIPAFVKLDVEGSERDVLRGPAATLGAECPPIWMIEVNYETSAAFRYRPIDLLDWFGGGYGVFRIADEGLVPEVEPETAPNGSNWILVPRCHGDRVDA
jgi:FkbM family methyltransferase